MILDDWIAMGRTMAADDESGEVVLMQTNEAGHDVAIVLRVLPRSTEAE